MALPRWTKFNKIERKRAFEVSAFVSAFHFLSKPYFEPYYEKFDFSQIFLVLDGEGSYTTGGKTYPISRGMMFYRPSGVPSIYEWKSERAEFALVSFVCESEAARMLYGAPTVLCEEEMSLLLDIINTGERICEPIKENETVQGMKLREDVPDVVFGFIASSLERFLSMVYCRICGISLVTDESRGASDFIGASRLVSEVKLYLAANISEKLSISSVCVHFGIGQTSLMKKFKRECGVGVMEYFTMLKIDGAKELISATALDFSEIADALGFSSANYFSRVFKERVGMTPTEYSRYVSKRKTITK